MMTKNVKIDVILRLQNQNDNLDNEIAQISSERNAKIIREHYSNLKDLGVFSVPKLWSLKKKLHLNSCDVPVAKKDNFGNLITNRPVLLTLYEDEYKNRLADKPPMLGYENSQAYKDYLFKFSYI